MLAAQAMIAGAGADMVAGQSFAKAAGVTGLAIALASADATTVAAAVSSTVTATPTIATTTAAAIACGIARTDRRQVGRQQGRGTKGQGTDSNGNEGFLMFGHDVSERQKQRLNL
ncbi:hypothetical protein D3C84_978510 [compost metagenome]